MARSAALKSKGASQGQLRLEQARAAAEAGRERAPAPRVAAPPTPPPPPMVRTVYAAEAPAMAFCAWLLTQKGGSGFIGGLATAAASDRTFPKGGDVAAAQKWLHGRGASGDDWEALEDAESAWLAA